MCGRVFSVGFGPGLDSMSPARSRRYTSHVAGTHGWLPQKTGRPGLRRGGVGGYNLHSVPPDSPPDCGTVAHQPRAGCIRLVLLSPIPFNIYTNDNPLHNGTRSFMYADDLCVTAQQPSFLEVETTIEESLSELTQYYRSNNLRANPDKTKVTAFHLRNKEAKRTLKVKWNRTDLENLPHPKYLGVTLDRTLSYKQPP